MHVMDQTFAEPERNLACDEALLNWCDYQQMPVLRLWESTVPFVVMGYANRLPKEINRPACEALGVKMLRRCSGGGTVLQGPGCLSYALALPLVWAPEILTVSGANAFIMAKHRDTLKLMLPGNVTIEGHTDLVWNGKKFSGNSQRRTRSALLFHGTFLLKFDLGLIEQTLQVPLLQPDYRQQRTHTEFITNIPLSTLLLKSALRQAWGATSKYEENITKEIDALMSEKYGHTSWHEKF